MPKLIYQAETRAISEGFLEQTKKQTKNKEQNFLSLKTSNSMMYEMGKLK